ncbi:ubiquitin carboxyl-terminal hydrolase-domain-containing protein [Elsinoe ampelina]|uniref:PAN2-PAN3 deadenylation complex catalytic subunit PAN2 n=1 Tax=Elsinoe ampelina TaxID=302913 RepID=A0A6A6GNW4_9PEZI|nr:ubiquitin carboxyl-terminal hydrolase-domain-containing protein [Elsinoe ampelina]
MEADWDEVARILLPPPGPNALHTPVSALVFDNTQELLWTGNEYGRVTSFYSNELQKYTSYRGHPSSEGPVKQFLVCDKGILSVSSKSVHLSSRKGVAQWHLSEPDMTDLRCMSFTTKGTGEIIVAGCQAQMFRIDVDKGAILETLPAEGAYTLMRRGGQHICAAGADGNVHILDPNTFKIVRAWKAHSGWINDMDVRSEILVTCGWSPRQQHGFMLDHLANVFDLKNMTPLPPVPFPPGAAFVRMHPRMSTTCIVASQTGLMYAIDIMNPDNAKVKHANLYDTHLLTLDLAPSGEAIAIADAQCAIHLWGSPNKVQFTEYSNPTAFADSAQPVPPIDWSPEIPLNLVGMPYYRDTLFSAWPSHLVHEVGAPPAKIDPKIVASLKRADMGGYAPWPQKTRRYQVEDTRAVQRAQDTLAAPKFLSEKARDAKEEGVRHNGERRISDALEFLAGMNLESNSRRDVPVIYKNVEIKYSKFGVDDFDFEYFNKTKYSGLETHISNSYANPLLQLLRFIPVMRNFVLHHTATSCLYEPCLLCEMGFLTDMLEKAGGMNCQASNFLKVYSSLPETATLGLLEDHAHNNPLTVMIQAANRYFLRAFSESYKRIPGYPLALEHALTTAAVMAIRCGHCGNEMLKPGDTIVHDLVYPPKSPKHHPRQLRHTFSHILKASIERQESSRGWCDRCKRYQQLNTKKSIQALPKVMMINAAIHTLDQRQLWASPNWLPQEIGVIINGDRQVYIYEGQDLRLHIQRGVYNITVYELIGFVADIHAGENQSSHLVSCINVSPSCRNPKDIDSWHLFNDFLVRQISPSDALHFDATWKLPSVLAYQVKSASKVIDDSWKASLDPTLLYHLPRGPHKSPPTDQLRPLAPAVETPLPMQPMAIDAEFVALSKAEIDLKADGTRETIRPPRLGLARVSVLRGAGSDTGLPFIDDYIAINEPVVDYLTAYSGISPGDLDRSVSKHNLVSLKAAYKKLWLLLNLGVVFVGHGLAKDFRTINIHVPKAQVIDTIELFSLGVRSQRKLSLRFLAWYLLREEVQEGEHGHDSVEDARTALKLWEKWKELDERGIVEPTIDDIWIGGRDVGFKAPSQWKAEQKRGEEERSGTPAQVVASAPGTPGKRVVGLAGGLGKSPLR